MSITYGTPIGSMCGPIYASGPSDMGNYLPQHPSNYPCSEFPGRLPPSFVHDNYYCESGAKLSSSGVYSLMILCGMVTIPPVITVAFLSQTYHGSIVRYHLQPLMILKLGLSQLWFKNSLLCSILCSCVRIVLKI